MRVVFGLVSHLASSGRWNPVTSTMLLKHSTSLILSSAEPGQCALRFAYRPSGTAEATHEPGTPYAAPEAIRLSAVRFCVLHGIKGTFSGLEGRHPIVCGVVSVRAALNVRSV